MTIQTLVDAFRSIRSQSVHACEPLELEDYGLQAASFSSPPKWHLGHVSWLYEVVLSKLEEDYEFYSKVIYLSHAYDYQDKLKEEYKSK